MRGPSCYAITNDVLEQTQDYLRISADRKIEVVVLWSGILDGTTARVRRAWLPNQYVAEGLFVIPGEELFALNKEIFELGERLVAQVHTHPTLAFHSETDEEFAVTAMEGGLSIVVPRFGLAHVASPDECAYFVFRAGRWRHLSRTEVRRFVRFEE